MLYLIGPQTNQMKHLLLYDGAVSLGAAAQSTITYPYNPDEDGNGQIAVADLQGILSTYGNAFTPSEILVDGETLTTVLTQLQNSIDSLSGLAGGGGSVLDMPLGTVLPIATESVPEGWMLCDGREIAIEEYQGLYDLIGTTYGAGDSAFWAQVFYPATTFNIPDLRGRTIIGANDMGGEQSDVLAIHSASVGEVGGEEMHQLAEVEMPIHTHAPEGSLVSSFEYGAVENGNGNNRVFVSELTLGDGQAPSGGDQPHNNMQPYIALNYMMKVLEGEDLVAALQDQVDSLMNRTISFEEESIDYQLNSENLGNNQGYSESSELLTLTVGPNSLVELHGHFDIWRGQSIYYSHGQILVTNSEGEILPFKTASTVGQSDSHFSHVLVGNCSQGARLLGMFTMRAFFENSEVITIRASSSGANNCCVSPLGNVEFSGSVNLSISSF